MTERKLCGLRLNKPKINSDIELILVLLSVTNKGKKYKDGFEDGCRVTAYILSKLPKRGHRL